MILPLLLALLAQADDRPSVVLVMTDDQGYGDLGAHGNDRIRTPQLDAFVKQSVGLEQFHVSPVCSPTRSSLLTGRYNYRTGVVDTFIGRSLMHSGEVTLAELLREAGYRTGIFGKWHLGDNYPLRAIDQGFQEALVLKGGGIGQPSDPPGGDHYTDATLLRNGVPEKTKGYITDVLTDEAIRFIQSSKGPFFAYVPYNAPHTPLEVPEEYLKPYLDAGLKEETARVYAMVTNIDHNVGRILAALEEARRAENTIVIFLTDNGPQQERYNAGMRGRKGTVFQGGIRVPFYVRWPRVLKAGHKVDRIAAHIDVAPTILEACGVKRPEGIALDGMSLLPLLKGGKVEGPDRTLFFQWHRGDEPELHRACAARTQRWKLVRQQPKEKPLLFDLEADPGEKTDVSVANPEVVAYLTARYEAWFKDVGAARGYAPPRISLGAPQENPAVLTRQDWRGPEAGWGPRSAGHWEVEVAREGTYELTLWFRAPPAAATVRASLNGISVEADVEAAVRRRTIRLEKVPAGPGRLEGGVTSSGGRYGLEYVEVRRLEP